MLSPSSRGKRLLVASIATVAFGMFATLMDPPNVCGGGIVTLLGALFLFIGIGLFGASLLSGGLPPRTSVVAVPSGPSLDPAPDAGPYRSSGAVVPSVRGPRDPRATWVRWWRVGPEIALTGIRLACWSGCAGIVFVALCRVSVVSFEAMAPPLAILALLSAVPFAAGVSCMIFAVIAHVIGSIQRRMLYAAVGRRDLKLSRDCGNGVRCTTQLRMSDRSVVGAMRLKRSRPLLRVAGGTFLIGLFLCLVHPPSAGGLDYPTGIGVLFFGVGVLLYVVALLVSLWQRLSARSTRA